MINLLVITPKHKYIIFLFRTFVIEHDQKSKLVKLIPILCTIYSCYLAKLMGLWNINLRSDFSAFDTAGRMMVCSEYINLVSGIDKKIMF